jgi:hypothetical protein
MTKTEVPPIDPSVPRRCIYRAFEGEPGPCRRCQGTLHQQVQTYSVATRRGNRLTDMFMISSDFGWFREDCLTLTSGGSS